MLVSCDSGSQDIGECYNKAAGLCHGPYEVIDRTLGAQINYSTTPYKAAGGVMPKRDMMIQCSRKLTQWLSYRTGKPGHQALMRDSKTRDIIDHFKARPHAGLVSFRCFAGTPDDMMRARATDGPVLPAPSCVSPCGGSS